MNRLLRLAFGTCALIGAAGSALARTPAAGGNVPQRWSDLPYSWALEPGIVVPLALVLAWYARGAWESSGPRGVVGAPRRRGRRHHARTRATACFLGGWLALALALASPLHPCGQVLFSAHAAQHAVLLLVAAPLLVLARPEVELLRALPPSWLRELLARAGERPWKEIGRVATRPLGAWSLHAAVLWLWHQPAAFRAALENDAVHGLQHLSLLASALLFWWVVLRGPHRAAARGTGAFYLLTTAFHTALLGTLIATTARPWYGAEPGMTAPWGLTPLADQRLGGLILWIPAGAAYVVTALALISGRLHAFAERARHKPAMVLRPRAVSDPPEPEVRLS